MLVAEDMTATAFNTANARLRGLETTARSSSARIGSAFSGLRSAAGFLGVALSVRAFSGWIAGAVRAAEVTGEHAEQIRGAQEALESMKRASDELALSFALKLVPALAAVATGWSRILTDADPVPFEQKITQQQRLLTGLKAQAEASYAVPKLREDLLKQIAATETVLADLKTKQEQALGVGIGGTQQGFGEVKFSDADQVAIKEKEAILQQKLNELTRQSLADKEAEFDLVTAVYAERERVAALEIDQSAELADAVAKERERVIAEDQEQDDRRRELLAQHVEDVRLNLLTETEYEAEAYAQRQALLDEALQQKLISEQQYAQQSTALARQHAKTEEDIAKAEAQREKQLQLAKLGASANLFAGLAAIAEAGGEQSKKQFEQHKKLSIAAAIIDTYASVVYALRNPPGPPFSFVQAAAAAAFGFAQVRQIQSTSWSGGGGGFGGVGFGSGGSEIAAASTINDRTAGLLSGDGSGGRGGTQLTVNIQGSVIGMGGARELAAILADELRDHLDQTDTIIINPSSRQAMTLRGEGVQGETV